MSDFVRRGSLRDDALNLIISLIAKKEIKPGEKIKESVISERLGISRVPIREAFRLLERQGIVEYVPRKGIFASKFSETDISEIYGIRIMVDVYCAEFIINNITDEHIKELRKYVSDMTFANDANEYSIANDNFHKRLIEIANNKKLMLFWDYIENQTKLIMSNCMNIEVLYDLSLKLHFEILEALIQRDVELYIEKIKKHHSMAREKTIEIWLQQNL